jgi:hypothetical protein
MMIDVQMRLDMLQQQLRWIEREIRFIRAQVAKSAPSTTPPRPFSELRGVWDGVVFDEDDIRASRLKMPEGL